MSRSNEMTHPQLASNRVGLDPKKEVGKVSHNRTWQDNAIEFAALDRGEGWQFAILVACSVEKRGHGGDRRSTDDRRLKVSAAEFARLAGTGDTRVARYLDAWQDAAAKGWVPDAGTLSPADARDLVVPDKPWRAKDEVAGERGVYDASRTGGQINNTEQIAQKAAANPEYATRMMRDVLAAVPEETKRGFFIDLSADETVTSDARTRGTAEKNIGKAAAASDFASKAAHADEQEEAASKGRSDIRFISVDGYLREAVVKVRSAVNEMDGVTFSDEERDLLNIRLVELARLVEAAQTDLTSGGVDWDAELAKIGGEQQ